MDNPFPDTRLPKVMHHPYLVVGPDGVRCGLVRDLAALGKLLAGDPAARVFAGRRGYVEIQDLDAWLLLERTFKLADYLPKSYVKRLSFPSGARCYDLLPPSRTPGPVLGEGLTVREHPASPLTILRDARHSLQGRNPRAIRLLTNAIAYLLNPERYAAAKYSKPSALAAALFVAMVPYFSCAAVTV